MVRLVEAPSVARASERHEWEYSQRQHQEGPVVEWVVSGEVDSPWWRGISDGGSPPKCVCLL